MLLNTYNPLPLSPVRAEGCYVYDSDGQGYLDAVSGVAVCNLGHCHPAITETILAQAKRLVHVSNLVRIEEQERLAAQLLDLSGLHSIFFGNSGSEANETAVKIARRWGQSQGIAEPKALCFPNAFHGRTLAMIAAAANPVHVQGFDPLPAGFVHSPNCDLGDIEALLASQPDIAAIMIEPIQGEGGVIVHPEGFLFGLQELAQRHRRLLILDEVQTGSGRTGSYFHFLQDERLRPDIVTLAKGMANGLPIGACLVSEPVSAVMTPGSHGSTFGGNPLACSVTSKVIEVLESEGLYQRSRQIGDSILARLRDALGSHPRVVRIQGCGMMIGVELAEAPAFDVPREFLSRHRMLVNLTATKSIRLLPPLVLSQDDAERLADAVIEIVSDDALFGQ